MDGSFQNQTLQVGAGNDVNDRISISIGSAKANALGVGGGSSYSTAVAGLQVGSSALAANSLSINGYMVGGAGSDGVSFAYGDTSGIAVGRAHTYCRHKAPNHTWLQGRNGQRNGSAGSPPHC